MSFTPSYILINRIKGGQSPLINILPVKLLSKYTNFLRQHNLIFLDQLIDATGLSLIDKMDLFIRDFNHITLRMSNSRFFKDLEDLVLDNNSNRLLKIEYRLDHSLPIYKHLAIISIFLNLSKEFIASWNPILNTITFRAHFRQNIVSWMVSMFPLYCL